MKQFLVTMFAYHLTEYNYMLFFGSYKTYPNSPKLDRLSLRCKLFSIVEFDRISDQLMKRPIEDIQDCVDFNGV